MADIFVTNDAKKLLQNKHIMFIGDSNIRGQYKDLIWLLNHNTMISQNDLKAKKIGPLVGDKLIKRRTTLGRDFYEQRMYEKHGIRVDFYFITQCFSPIVEELLEDIHLDIQKAPDVIFMNSTLWDVARWGPNGVTKFKDNLVTLAKTLKDSLPPTTLVIWGTALPIAQKIESSLLVKQINFLQNTLRFDVMEANLFARQVMTNYGHDVLDNHFYMRMQIHRRVPDGVHFFSKGIRFLTNLLLTHIALSWDHPLPCRVDTLLLEKSKHLSLVENKQPEPVVPVTPKAFKIKENKAKFNNQNQHQRPNRQHPNRQGNLQQTLHKYQGPERGNRPGRQQARHQANRQQTLHSALHEYQGPAIVNGLVNHQQIQNWQELNPVWDRNEEIRLDYALRMQFLQNQRYQPY